MDGCSSKDSSTYLDRLDYSEGCPCLDLFPDLGQLHIHHITELALAVHVGDLSELTTQRHLRNNIAAPTILTCA